jgi:hypothetical protein
VFSVVFCVWEQVSGSLTRRGVGGSSINWRWAFLGFGAVSMAEGLGRLGLRQWDSGGTERGQAETGSSISFRELGMPE